MTGYEIAPLRNERDASMVAGWIWDEWARHEPGVTRDACEAGVHASLGSAALPCFLAAYADDQPIGCASIIAADLPSRPDLGPWLANVFVTPSWRGRGVGTALIRTATSAGCALAGTLYLYTFDTAGHYARLGWELLGTDRYVGRPITLMRYACSTSPALPSR